MIKYIKAIRAKYFPDPNAQKLVVTSKLPTTELSDRFEKAGFRRGMWVILKSDLAIGIASEIATNPLDNSEVILFQRTDPISGINLVSEFVPPSLLRQARFAEIPAQRRPTDSEAAGRKGYA